MSDEEDDDCSDCGHFYDVIVMYSDSEKTLAESFCEEIRRLNIGDGVFPVIDTFENVSLAGNQDLDNLDYAVEHATFIVFFRTKEFFKDEMRSFAAAVALDNAIRSKNKSQRWSFIPIDVEKKVKIPGRPSINSLSGFTVTKDGSFDKDLERVRRTLRTKMHVRAEREQNSAKRKANSEVKLKEKHVRQQADVTDVKHVITSSPKHAHVNPVLHAQEKGEETHNKVMIQPTQQSTEIHLEIVNPSLSSEEASSGTFLKTPVTSAPHTGCPPFANSSGDSSPCVSVDDDDDLITCRSHAEARDIKNDENHDGITDATMAKELGDMSVICTAGGSQNTASASPHTTDNAINVTYNNGFQNPFGPREQFLPKRIEPVTYNPPSSLTQFSLVEAEEASSPCFTVQDNRTSGLENEDLEQQLQHRQLTLDQQHALQFENDRCPSAKYIDAYELPHDACLFSAHRQLPCQWYQPRQTFPDMSLQDLQQWLQRRQGQQQEHLQGEPQHHQQILMEDYQDVGFPDLPHYLDQPRRDHVMKQGHDCPEAMTDSGKGSSLVDESQNGAPSP